MTWLNLLGFLKSNWRVLALVFGALALWTCGYAKGHHDGKASEVRAEASRLSQARKAVAKREVKAATISEHVAADLSKERVRIEYRTRTLIERVPTYVTPASDTACVVPVGFVQLYNAAASPTGVPSSPGGSVEASSGVPLSAVLETDVWNLGVAQDLLAEVKAWRAWYQSQSAAWKTS